MAQGQHHAGHEGFAVQCVVTDFQHLGGAAKKHLLARHIAGQTHGVDLHVPQRAAPCAFQMGHAVGAVHAQLGVGLQQTPRRGQRRAAGVVLLAVVVIFHNLDMGHHAGGHFGKAHHQHRPHGKVGHHPHRRLGVARDKFLQTLQARGVVAAGAHHQGHTRLDDARCVVHEGFGVGEVQRHVKGAVFGQGLGHRGAGEHAGGGGFGRRGRVHRARKHQVLFVRQCADDLFAHAPGAAHQQHPQRLSDYFFALFRHDDRLTQLSNKPAGAAPAAGWGRPSRS